MSEPTPRDKELLKVYRRMATVLKSYGFTPVNDLLAQLVAANDSLRNAEVLAVLDELEDELQPYSDDYTYAGAVPLSAITQLKQRYGGKEQGE